MQGPWAPLIWREESKLSPQRFAVKGGKPASPYLGGKGGKHSFSEFCGTGGFPSVAPLQEGQVIVRPEPNAEMGTGQASLVLVSSSSRLVSSSSRLRLAFVRLLWSAGRNDASTVLILRVGSSRSARPVPSRGLTP